MNIVFKNGDRYQRGSLISQKKAKALYEVDDHPELMIMRFLDIVASDDGRTTMDAPGKGRFCGTINDMMFELLRRQYVDRHNTIPIKTHYISAAMNDPAECLVWRVKQPIALEVIVRNWAYGSFCRKYGVAEGMRFERPVCEFTLKDDTRNDPLIPEEHIWALEIADRLETEHMRSVALAANRILSEFFHLVGIELIDFKLVFGRISNVMGDYSNLYVIGEISPDTCRLRDIKTGKCLDKDIFRKGLEGLPEAYQTVSQKLLAYRNPEKHKHVADDYDENGIPFK